jgi:hypothetical protein
MKTKEELNKTRNIILEILERDERARNDDKWLTFQVMRRFTNIYIPFEDFAKIPAFESIKRIRAYIQNKEKRFVPTDETAIKRRTRANKFKEVFR